MMEQILDVTLKNETHGHSEAQVEHFYQTFKENMEAYKAMNEDVMDVLFGMVDFNKFKQSVLEYKKGFQNADADQTAKENQELQSGKQGLEYEEFMKEYNRDPDEKGSGWVKKLAQKDFKNGIKMSMWQKKNEIPGRPDWLRFDCSMLDVSDHEAILNFMKNP